MSDGMNLHPIDDEPRPAQSAAAIRAAARRAEQSRLAREAGRQRARSDRLRLGLPDVVPIYPSDLGYQAQIRVEPRRPLDASENRADLTDGS